MASLLCVAITIASVALTSAAEATKPDKELQDLLHQAISLPPEFAADALLRLVETGKVPDRKLAIQALEDAHHSANTASSPVAVAPVPIGFTDSAAAMIGQAASTANVERLSLQSRAIRQMALMDPMRAVAMLNATAIGDLRQTGCAVEVVPDVRLFYDTLTIVANAAPSASGTRKRSLGEDLISEQMSKIYSIGQAFAMAKTLATVKLPPPSIRRLVLAFGSVMSTVADGDRAFSIALFYEPQRHALGSLLNRCDAGDCDSATILSAVSAMYARHLKSARCEDTFLDEHHRSLREEALADLNHRLIRSDMKELLVTEPHDPKLTHASITTDFYDSDAVYRELMKTCQQIGGKRAGWSDAEREERVRSALSRILAWNRDASITAQQFFLMRSEIFGALMKSVVGTSLSTMVLSSYASYLNISESDRRQFPAEWLWRTLELYHGPPQFQDQQAERQSWQSTVTAELERSPNPILNYYARLYRIGALQ